MNQKFWYRNPQNWLINADETEDEAKYSNELTDHQAMQRELEIEKDNERV